MKFITLFVCMLIVVVLCISQLSNILYPKIPLKSNEKAPLFTLKNTENQEVKLDDFKGSPVIIYFFPKANTPGCTAQACALRDKYADFSENKILIIGISYDSPEKMATFKTEHHLPFVLLSDQDKKVAKLYGANRAWPFNFFPHRITFLLDKEGTIKEIMPHVSVTTHAAEIFAKAKKLV